MRRIIEHIIVTGAVLVAIAIGLAIYAWSGAYDIGADAHHGAVTYSTLQFVRNRSIEVRSADLKVPNLNDPQLILKGAGQYAAMCTECHLKPGVRDSEMRAGMYPRPPNLSKVRIEPRNAFWAIKHGIKMSAMPAWGGSHDDPTIWSMVAFLQKLPALTPRQYEDIVARAPPDEDMDTSGGHEHGHAHDER
jgi:mono/diheme cytochrome c family protein